MVGVNCDRRFILLVLRERGRGTSDGDERVTVESVDIIMLKCYIHRNNTQNGDNANE